MKSVMVHQFSQVPGPNIPRSVFNRSHGHKTAFDADYLIPILIDEALPGDTFRMKATVMARMNTPICPIMDNLFLDTFYFAVPFRLLWENWEGLAGGGDHTVPTVNVSGHQVGSVYDYFGIPQGAQISGAQVVNALPFRAYQLIWNDWFRAQDVTNDDPPDTDDGPDTVEDYSLLKRYKRHDYFTSCLTEPQAGDAITLPIGSTAPVIGNGDDAIRFRDGSNNLYLYNVDQVTTAALTQESYLGIGDAVTPTTPTAGNKALGLAQSTTGMIADLTNATASTINDLREAFQLQKMLEKDKRGGTRYTEVIRTHFGVISPDARLQRPELLAMSSQRINMTSVPQTSESNNTEQGNLAAYSVTVDGKAYFNKSFTEHCYIIGLANVRGDLTYQYGTERLWYRQDREDFYWPSLAHLGEQEVPLKEIYTQGASSGEDDDIFGYQERYAEYRYKPSRISGILRSTAAASLDVWHVAETLAAAPVLDTTWLLSNVQQELDDRTLSVPSEPAFVFDSYFDYKCVRPMPVYSIPGMIDHF